jgi:predicted Zn-dependent protease with MMP-like domain
MKLSDREFAEIILSALDRIPPEFRHHIANVAITVQDRPPRALMEEMGLPPGEELFGIYMGGSLTERSVTYPSLYSESIMVFKEPLENARDTPEELVDEIEITIVHEVAHFFGISEERLRELGYD